MANKTLQDKALHAIYARILLYSFLTQSKVSSINEILETILEYESNKRILANLELSTNLLQAIQAKANNITLNVLNSKIWTNNSLLKDTSLSIQEKHAIIEKKFEGTIDCMMLHSINGLLYEKSFIMNNLSYSTNRV